MNDRSKPFVSFVTPVFNGAEYLSECIESVLAQTHSNWDYTIVDNCSTDGTLDIARRYAEKDARIRVHRNDRFLPVVANHNAALRQISPASKYCKVVFADDWIFPECVEKMVAVAEQDPTVGLVSAYCLEGRDVSCTGLPYSTTIMEGRETGRHHLLNRLYLFGSANCVLYRSDLVRNGNPFYNESNIHADTEVCFSLLRACNFGFVHQVLTFTRVRPGSETARSQDLRTYLSGMLRVLVTHGAYYLTEAELKTRLDQHLSEYYEFLSRSLVGGVDREAWSYHRAQLINAGMGFSRARLVRATLANLGRAATNPRDTFRKVLRAGR